MDGTYAPINVNPVVGGGGGIAGKGPVFYTKKKTK